MTEQAIAALQQSLRGRLIQPTDADYDAARALYNGMIDKRPRLLARCVDTADVITAVNFARDHNVLVAIRGGGHNGPGLGGLSSTRARNRSVDDEERLVDPAAKTVRVEPGCTSGDACSSSGDCRQSCRGATDARFAEGNRPRRRLWRTDVRVEVHGLVLRTSWPDGDTCGRSTIGGARARCGRRRRVPDGTCVAAIGRIRTPSSSAESQ